MATVAYPQKPASPASDGPTDSLCGLVTSLDETRYGIEVELVQSITADTTRGVPIAERAGVDCDLFLAEDLGILYYVFASNRDADRMKLVQMSVFALKRTGFWFPGGPVSVNRPWNTESLSHFFTAVPFCTSLCERLSAQLVEIDRRRRQALAMLSELVDLLRWTPDEPEPVRKRVSEVLAKPANYPEYNMPAVPGVTNRKPTLAIVNAPSRFALKRGRA